MVDQSINLAQVRQAVALVVKRPALLNRQSITLLVAQDDILAQRFQFRVGERRSIRCAPEYPTGQTALTGCAGEGVPQRQGDHCKIQLSERMYHVCDLHSPVRHRST